MPCNAAELNQTFLNKLDKVEKDSAKKEATPKDKQHVAPNELSSKEKRSRGSAAIMDLTDTNW